MQSGARFTGVSSDDVLPGRWTGAMRTLVRQAWTRSAVFLPLRVAGRMAAQAVLAPCYHLIADQPPAHVRHLYRCRTPAAFESDLDLLLRHFKPISLAQLAGAVVEHGTQPPGTFFLSVDDGLREVSETIAPICLKKGVPATLFLNTAFLDNQALCYRHKASILVERAKELGDQRTRGLLGSARQVDDPASIFLATGYPERDLLDRYAAVMEVDFEAYLRENRPYLTSPQVRQLQEHGFDIGGHGVDHPLYAVLSLDEQLAQTRQCMAELDRRFHLRTKAFAFPFVSDGVGAEFYRTILGEGTADLICSIGGVPEEKTIRTVQRFGVEGPVSRPLARLIREQAARGSLARFHRWRHWSGITGRRGTL